MNKLTNWEVGQDLIYLSDEMGEKVYDFNKQGHRELAIKLDLIRAQIGDLFNQYGKDHSFGIFDSDSICSLILKNKKERKK